MSKQEKYVGYIVKDMIRQTKIDNVGLITFPFMSEDEYYESILNSMSPPKRFYFHDFLDFAKKLYGVRDEEGEIIFDRYVEILQNG
tara:strand:+ start:1121 stop:1378 length:258 start_codon:yes stop_codon:yes gene_type:complete